MKTAGNEKIVTPEYDGLIYDLNPPANVFTVKIRKGTTEETLKRGTVLDLVSGGSGSGDMVKHGTTAGTGETIKANCILAEDVTVGTTENVAALAYRTGHFAENKLIGTISAADKEDLRVVGILLSDAVEY